MKIIWMSCLLGSSILMHVAEPQTWIQGLQALGESLVTETKATQSPEILIAAAGDIACEPDQDITPQTCQMQATSDLLQAEPYQAVLPLGDVQYERGDAAAFQSYNETWGRFKAISYPVVGNHEYYGNQAQAYFQYFGQRAGDPQQGYYSFDLGDWHLIALNGNCQAVGGCGENSPQAEWLKQDLATHPAACTLAYWHQPRFSSGWHGNNTDYQYFWQLLYDGGADLVLNGHDHHYERFSPQTPAGQLDERYGIREFVIGTGGKSLRPVLLTQTHSQIHQAQSFGILQLRLRQDGYSWAFKPITGQKFQDTGQATCHGPRLNS